MTSDMIIRPKFLAGFTIWALFMGAALCLERRIALAAAAT